MRISDWSSDVCSSDLLSLSTRHYKTPEGMPFRDRERLILLVYPDFPFRVPFLYFQHKRFLGAPHVQWGSYICLYQSTETEWTPADRSEEHTSELQSLMRISYAVFCLKKKK